MSFLSEDNGNKSSARLIALICVIWAGVLGGVGLWKGSELLGLTALCTAFLGWGIGGKAYQKGKEKSDGETK